MCFTVIVIATIQQYPTQRSTTLKRPNIKFQILSVYCHDPYQ